MMSLRRWLTAKYDWTGLSGLLYRSLSASLTAFILLAVVVVAFAYYQGFGTGKLLRYGHYFEMIAIAGVFAFILLPNLIRMWHLTIAKPKVKVLPANYFKVLGELFVHMFTQKRALGCDDNRIRWFEHFILVIGYLSLLFTTVFLDWFATGSGFVTAMGYVESAIIFSVTFLFVLSRITKKEEVSKHAHPSDWFFVVWLFLMGVSAFLVRLFIDLDLLEQNIWIYVVHLIILVQWALIIVPFGKWTHFLYRSFAMYFQSVKESAK
jgi:hypothetical protein